jgi:serine/threonine protein phosphatase PrpC
MSRIAIGSKWKVAANRNDPTLHEMEPCLKSLEAFSLGKNFGQPEANEDCMVIMPNLGYAVIDGVTDRNGTRYDGMLSGQFAARTVQRALEQFLQAQGDLAAAALHYRGPDALIAELNRAVHEGYRRNGALHATKNDWKQRGGCTLMVAFRLGDRLQVVAVGDSGIRINGNDTLQVLKPLDDVTAILRRETWRHFEALGSDPESCDELSRAITFLGTRNQMAGSPTSDPTLIETIETRAFEASRHHLPLVPEAELFELIQQGIVNGQGNFLNITDRALGYGGLDGFYVPSKHIEARSYAYDEVETLELFSDGYFAMGADFGVASWEAAFAATEAEDPHKIGTYMSVKGTTDKAVADDRTYLGVRLF